MIKHYIILIVSIIILIYMFYRTIKKDKLSNYTNDFIIKGRESNILTSISLVFTFICLCSLIISIALLIKEINWLINEGINLSLLDLLVPRRFRLLLETLSKDIKGNIFEITSLINARKSLFSTFYLILFIFVCIYFYYANSRPVYIANDGIYKFGKLYKWNTSKLHEWDRVFGRDILNANVIDENSRPEIISFRLYNDDKKTLETLIGAKSFIDNNT